MVSIMNGSFSQVFLTISI